MNSLDKLIDMTPIEQIGAFVPRRRSGYPDNRREERMRNSMARTLYSRRLSIADNIANSKFDDRQEVITSSLVASGISPNSVLGWSDYIDLLVSREGGWSLWRDSVKHDVSIIDSAREQAVKSWIYVVTLSAIALIAGNSMSGLPYHIGTAAFFVMLAGCMALAVLYAAPASALMRTASRELMGNSSRKTSDFVKAEHL